MTATACRSEKSLDCELKTSAKKLVQCIVSRYEINGYFMIYPTGRKFAISLMENSLNVNSSYYYNLRNISVIVHNYD